MFLCTTIIFSCASAKAERSLSSLYGVFLCVELGDPPTPPCQDFTGLDQNATPLLYDSKFAHECKILWVQTVTLHLNENFFFITDLT